MEKVDIDVREQKLALETGEIAKQADGSVIAQYGDTVVLATAVSARKAREGLDFFPLTIDYQEKAYSAGKIPGGFLKREGRPSAKEILTSRLTDRPMRPLFPNDYKFETQGIITVLSYGEENVSDVLGITAMSAAFTVSDIPFDGPVAAVRVGRINGEFILNPDVNEIESCDLSFVVAGTGNAVVMVEGEADEVPEDIVLGAIDYAHENIKRLVSLQNDLAQKAGKPKRSYVVPEKDNEFPEKVREAAFDRLKSACVVPGKLERQKVIDKLQSEIIEDLNMEGEDRSSEIAEIFHDFEREIVREMILNDRTRADGRKPDQIRDISCKIGFLPRAHGSALFERGETQAIVAATLGTSHDEQKIDSLDGESYKGFMLHYNFPPFSVGEVKPLRSPGRREIGHGALAEKSIKQVIPSNEDFPYTIRVVSDITESNGSSSMATVCGATLSLMDAGVPIKAPVAGIAMGLVQEGDSAVVLSDILGLEDHLGDMDFKVTGTEKGITAFQMDVKIAGISHEIMEKALSQAREGMLFILSKIKETIAEPRSELPDNAPRIYTMQVKKEKIRDIIGTGGKVIRGIIEETGCKIDINDDGVVNIASIDEESARMAKEIIKGIIEDAELGKIYLGKVKKVVDFGAFVEILPGTEGLLHISQIADKRIAKVTDEINEGDEVMVKVIEIDRAGKLKLSRKAAMHQETAAK
ncbi:polyribonucleotide nucleotidyltransferase [bacterium BMS3Abin07]|nr:polyribonucleotide nucleotidyltransferase [bacterium BMS3Abin07]HDO23402.1 polyribonucleotide nucleotidyltransferase [Nitrospirota bacterium]HDZ87619.1 polyribonucleotide nucleotidyltransferase [Nitrospirota bacterium]